MVVRRILHEVIRVNRIFVNLRPVYVPRNWPVAYLQAQRHLQF